MVVADGMGGHAGARSPAQIAVRLFIERFQQEAKPMLKNPLGFLQESMVKAHAALGSYSTQFSMLETPRTTCVACIVQRATRTGRTSATRGCTSNGRARWSARPRTHSKVQYLVDQGVIGAATPPSMPTQQGLQLSGRHDRAHHRPFGPDALRNGDLIVMCTDGCGVRWHRRDRVVARVDRRSSRPRRRCCASGKARRPGRDNLSAIVMRWVRRPSSTNRRRRSPRRSPGRVRDTARPDPHAHGRKGADRDLSDDEIERAIDEIHGHDPALPALTPRRRRRDAIPDGLCAAGATRNSGFVV